MVQRREAANFAVQLIVAGQGGLKAGPAFIEALERQDNLYTLRPWAVDYDLNQFGILEADSSERLGRRTRGRHSWRQRMLRTTGYESAIRATAERLGVAPLMRFAGPDDYLPNDRPQVLRCAANFHCQDWGNQFLSEVVNLPPQIRTLVVLFVYNPDGQTSGAATLELARTLRATINRPARDMRQVRLDAFQRKWVIGVELGSPDPMRQGAIQNTLAGYIRRKELLCLMESDEERPFGLSLVVDGSPPSVSGPVSFEILSDLAA